MSDYFVLVLMIGVAGASLVAVPRFPFVRGIYVAGIWKS
jgi:hypothetical protein